MNRHVTMSLLESIVLSDIVKVVASDDDGSLHFHLDDGSSQDSASNRHVPCERTLLVYVLALGGLTWSLETETNVSCVTDLLSW